MLADVFKNKEVVLVIDFMLDNPISEFSKTDIADGSLISRPTVYKVLPELEKLGVVISNRRFGRTELYKLNTGSRLVKSLLKFDQELTDAFIEANIDSIEVAETEYNVSDYVRTLTDAYYPVESNGRGFFRSGANIIPSPTSCEA